ncbi:YaaC family protein [Paludifilum halophilum]|uniref:YaaC-like Protein n=1 Tax=Paludifilum halophilum TaxID=1642702 RepID=A0A235B8J9_9BACL|nr:YaaC family protein [Paludifilum halophilum]OYD07905.1 hypothetical protein CHM34_07210 [Paludifilum halophilum]
MDVRPIRRISCDFPEQKMWNLFLILENETTVRRFLTEKYRRMGLEHPEKASFHTAHPLIYYIKQGRDIYRSAGHSGVFIRPLLSYYGMMNLAKAWMLSMDPEYPRNTAVLRHGVSTRKRKRRGFSFLSDEVRVQRNGLFAELARCVQVPPLNGESWAMRDLFSILPELQDGYRQLFRKATLFPVVVPDPLSKRNLREMPFFLEESILDTFHRTPRSLVEYLNRNRSDPEVFFSCGDNPVTGEKLCLSWHHPRTDHVDSWEKGFSHPLFREDGKGGYYLFSGNNRLLSALPEALVHYLILFALSMLCRYETPLWGEMIYGLAAEDMVLIQEFLDVSQRKFPNMILNHLFEEKLIFTSS